MRSPVSVIVPCYRCVDTIDRAIDSVIQQTMPPEEILLVEDCTDDGGATLASLHRLQQRYYDQANIRVIPLEKNCGPGGARNAAWEQAKEPYLAFLDADDSWHPRKLEIQWQWMASHTDVAMTGHRSIFISPAAALPELDEKPDIYAVNDKMLLLSNRFPTRTVMLQRDIAYRFDPTKRYAEDFLLWLRIVLSGCSAWFIELPMAYSYKADFGAGGLTKNLWKTEKGEIDTYLRICKEGFIPYWICISLLLLSLLKFLRRLAMSYSAH